MSKTKAATLNELLEWQAPNQKADDETVAQYLKRRLISHADSVFEDPHVAPDLIVAICKLTGDDPIQLIFDQTEKALSWEEPFRSHFFDDAQKWFTGADIDELMRQLDAHRERRTDQMNLVQATLDGRVRLKGDSLAIMP